MKRIQFFSIIIVALVLNGCATTSPISESTSRFTAGTKVSLAVPMRFYSWVKVDYANKIQPDIKNGSLEFDFIADGDYLLRTEANSNGVISIWGKQILLQDEDLRALLFTAFVPSVYALNEDKDSVDIAFESLIQIFADKIYSEYEKKMIDVIKNGLNEYRTGGDSWEKFKVRNFSISNKTLKIIN